MKLDLHTPEGFARFVELELRRLFPDARRIVVKGIEDEDETCAVIDSTVYVLPHSDDLAATFYLMSDYLGDGDAEMEPQFSFVVPVAQFVEV
jgi:hypothetical protein